MALLKRKKLTEVFICLGNPVLSVQVFLVIKQILSNTDIPIRTRIEQGSGMTYLLENHQDGHFFDIYQQTCTHELVIGGTHEMLARAVAGALPQKAGYCRSKAAVGGPLAGN